MPILLIGKLSITNGNNHVSSHARKMSETL